MLLKLNFVRDTIYSIYFIELVALRPSFPGRFNQVHHLLKFHNQDLAVDSPDT